MKLEVDDAGDLVFWEVYTGIGIRTDLGVFGIAQRDDGIEVMLNGKVVYSSSAPPVPDRLLNFMVAGQRVVLPVSGDSPLYDAVMAALNKAQIFPPALVEGGWEVRDCAGMPLTPLDTTVHGHFLADGSTVYVTRPVGVGA